MKVERLATRGFRNLSPLDLDLDAPFVVIWGENAQGKTNLLETVWALAALRPLRGRNLREVVAFGEAEASVGARVSGAEGTVGLRLDVGAKGRRLHLDQRPVHDLAPWFRAVRAIAFTPGDAQIVAGEPARRREWLDRAAFTADPGHLEVVRGYQRALDQKSALLKTGRPDLALLDVADRQVATLGAQLAHRRQGLIAELAPHIQSLHQGVAGEGDVLGIAHRSHAEGGSIEERGRSLADRIARSRSEELRRRSCLVGPQTDDVEFLLGGRPLRAHGSRGQVRSLVLALKLAEMVAARARGDVPVFLLDDASSELDRDRTRRLTGLLWELGAQVLATTTDPDHLGSLPGAEVRRIRLRAGRIAE